MSRESGRIKDACQKRILDEAARKRRQKKALEALEQDNFHDDPHADLEWGEVVLHLQEEDGGIDLENEIATETGGEDDREKEDEERDRVKSRDRDRDRERERDRHRRSYSRSRSRERDRSKHRVKPKPSTNERPIITEADLQGKTPEEQEMMRIMGFCDFDTTKGKKVDGNDVGAVHVILKRKYRQYMNRKGGFNRPLDFVA
ncbi:U4/U6.U5 small nuclear ribonucleoprotein 27 kDa protein [Trachymyrmex zeteki]|uniref:U4/U6.U5 small nuclear ribonucleoprotein 27 kDa protein n=1 Tax=Mycetomoellerius zeteki TaxID=64791 RepID=A0A151WPU9_9HYME|nr:U4/U6.U5 small nuclear ribonucleoprotein 27 kDa protein [Trachymyrmex zeteki]